MSQFDFGTIDPYVVDGVQLADMLNQWRDAIHTWHRGPTRPTYVVPGMMWINDAGGPTNWIVMVYMSVTIGDVPLFVYDTTTGQISVNAGGFVSAIITAQGTTLPQFRWNATANPIDAKWWRFTEDAAGDLVLAAYSDAGVVQNSITFHRNGTITTPLPTMRMLGETILAGPANEIRLNIPIAAKAVEIWFVAANSPANTAANLMFQALNGAAIQGANAYRSQFFFGAGNGAGQATFVAADVGWRLGDGIIYSKGVLRPEYLPMVGANAVAMTGTMWAQSTGGATVYALASAFDSAALVQPTGYRLANASGALFNTGSYLRAVGLL